MNTILVFLYDGMADFEITFLTHLLGGDSGKNIVTIASSLDIITSKAGVKYQPHITVDTALETYDRELIEGIIIPGGWHKETPDALIDLLKRLHDDKKLLAAICAGPRFLAKADILKGVKYTTSVAEWTDAHQDFFEERDPFPRYNYTGDRVTRDQHVVTAIGVAFVDFAIEVCDYLNLYGDEEEKLEFEHLIKG